MKNTIKINFVDFWDNFCKTDNYFYHLLSLKYKVEIDEKDPDFLFFSVGFNNKKEILKYVDKPCKKIFFTGENIRPNLFFPGSIHQGRYEIYKSDFSFSFDYSKDPRNYRLPLWVLFINWFNVEHNDLRDISYLINPKTLLDREFFKKDKFCNFIFSNNQGKRIEILQSIEKYKKIDCAGKLFNNMPNIQGRGDQKYKIDFLKNYKFTIASENSKYDGYTTEKLLHPLSVGSIPIYWGSSRVTEDFNKNCFINVDDFESLEDLVTHIQFVDANKQAYEEYILSPIFTDNKIPDCIKPENVLNFFEEKIL